MKTTKNTESESLNGTLEKDNNSSLIYEKVENTPFTIYGENEKCYVLLGSYRLSEELTYEEAKEEAKKFDWDKILKVIIVVMEDAKKQDEINNLKEEN